VDVGHLFADDFDLRKPDQLSEAALVMNEWMLKGFSKYRLDVANLSYRDVLYAGMVFDKQKYESQAQTYPALTDFISANVVAATDLDKVTAPPPYVIKEVSGKRFSKGSYKVGFIGLTQPGPGEKTGFVLQDPTERLPKILPEVRGKVDLVVVLAYVSPDEAKRLAQQNPGIDVLVGAYATPLPPPAQREGNTVIVYTVGQTKSLGELRLYLGNDGKVTDYLNRYVVLDTTIPDIPEAAQMIASSKTEINAIQAKINAEQDAANKAAAEALQQSGKATGDATKPESSVTFGSNKPAERTEVIINDPNHPDNPKNDKRNAAAKGK
jgi:2',3'-cyclic-nucleotide 2'-phosphodiesterase (5'-nucleotidase family)